MRSCRLGSAARAAFAAALGPALVGSLLLGACGPGDPTSWDGRRFFASQRTRLDPAPPGGRAAEAPVVEGDDGCDDVLSVMGTFAQRLAQRIPPAEVFDTVETCLQRRGRALELLDLTLHAVTLHPANPGLRVRRARALLGVGDFDEAARCCERALQRAPEHPEALLFLGLTQGRRPEPSERHLRQAVDAWRRLLRVQPEPKGIPGYGAEQLRRDLARFEAALGLPPPASPPTGEAPPAPAPPPSAEGSAPPATPPGAPPRPEVAP